MHIRPTLRQMLVVTFTLICVLPVAALAIWTHFGIKHHELDEARERQQMLAQNLATPIHAYLQGAEQVLAGFGSLASLPESQPAIAPAARQQRYFQTILALTPEGAIQRLTPAPDAQVARADAQLAALAAPFIRHAKRGQSDLIRNPYTGEPSLMLAEPVGGKLLIGLLDMKPIFKMGQQVKFGDQRHAAMTDARGNVMLYPDNKAIKPFHNIADWPIVQRAMQGKSGVSGFYSPVFKQDLIAGYAMVPDFNWLILTPQPLAEFPISADGLLHSAAWVALASLAIALILAALISGWIARPITALAKSVQSLPQNGFQDEFDELAKIAPREFDTLQRRSRKMAKEVRRAISLRDRMNDELAHLVDSATRRLKEANSQLAEQALIDDLTKLGNRRALWQRISDLEQTQGNRAMAVQVLLFDLDNFKEVNDTLGHAAGDQVLMHVAAILEQETREGDFVVRYGGDEFLVVMQQCTPGIAHERAQAIRRAVRAQPLSIEDRRIDIHMSVGIAESESKLSRPSFNELLKAADQAMYDAKAKSKERHYLISV